MSTTKTTTMSTTKTTMPMSTMHVKIDLKADSTSLTGSIPTTLDLSGCRDLSSLPEWLGDFAGLETLCLRRCRSVVELPESLKRSAGTVRTLDLSGCRSLGELPGWLGDFAALETLDLSGCSGLRELPEWVNGLQSLIPPGQTEEPLCAVWVLCMCKDELQQFLWIHGLATTCGVVSNALRDLFRDIPRCDTVHARLRIASLWRQISDFLSTAPEWEASHIFASVRESTTDPSSSLTVDDQVKDMLIRAATSLLETIEETRRLALGEFRRSMMSVEALADALRGRKDDSGFWNELTDPGRALQLATDVRDLLRPREPPLDDRGWEKNLVRAFFKLDVLAKSLHLDRDACEPPDAGKDNDAAEPTEIDIGWRSHMRARLPELCHSIFESVESHLGSHARMQVVCRNPCGTRS